MRWLGKLWADCHNGTIDPKEWHYERRISINGRYFLDNEIVNLKFDKGLVYNNFVLGACISGKVDFTLRPLISMTFPSVGNITVELRVKALDIGESDWHMFGTYRIDSVKQSDDIWTFVGYDALSDKKADSKKNYYEPPEDKRIGALTLINSVISGWLTLANPGSIDDSIKIDIYPEALKEYDEYGRVTDSKHIYDEYTRRELLSFIAQLNSGSFHIDENGDLKFVKVNYSANPVATVSKANSKRIVDGGPLRFSGITMRYSERRKQDVYNIGNSMNSLDMFNPLANIQSANSVYRAVMNMDYRAFNITSTQIDPAIELGDRIKVGDKETNLWQITLSPRNFADIDIPNLVDQYVYSDRTENNSECILLSMVGNKDLENIYANYSPNPIIGRRYIGDAECVIINNHIYEGRNSNVFSNNETIKRPILSNPSLGRNLESSFSHILKKREEGIDFSYFDTSQLYNAQNMFRGSNMNNFNFDGLNLESLEYLSHAFESTFGDKIDLSSTIPPTSRVRAEGTFKNSEVKELKLPFGIRLLTGTTFTGMKNLKHLDLSNVKLYENPNSNSFHLMESLETLNLNNASGDLSKSTSTGIAAGFSIYSFGDVTRPKYIDMRNFNNTSYGGTILLEKYGKVFDLSDIQSELTLNISGNFIYKRYNTGIVTVPESYYKFLPNKLNQPEKLLVICNESNIADLMNHYNKFYVEPNNSTWEEHNIEFIIDPEFEWNYEEDGNQ